MAEFKLKYERLICLTIFLEKKLGRENEIILKMIVNQLEYG